MKFCSIIYILYTFLDMGNSTFSVVVATERGATLVISFLASNGRQNHKFCRKWSSKLQVQFAQAWTVFKIIILNNAHPRANWREKFQGKTAPRPFFMDFH